MPGVARHRLRVAVYHRAWLSVVGWMKGVVGSAYEGQSASHEPAPTARPTHHLPAGRTARRHFPAPGSARVHGARTHGTSAAAGCPGAG